MHRVRRRRRSSWHRFAENLGQFGSVARGYGAGVEQSGGQPVHRTGVIRAPVPGAGIEELEFPLPPLHLGGGAAFGRVDAPGVDPVVAEFGQRGAIAAVQLRDVAGGGQPGHWKQRPVAHDRQDRIEQFVGNRRTVGTEGQANLSAGLTGREFEMPACVRAAGAPSQRHPVDSQVQAYGVVVQRFEVLGRCLLEPGDRREPFEARGHRVGAHVELRLDFEVPLRVRPVIP